MSGLQPHPIALTIAGSDSGGGAGIQADLKSFSALGVYGASVITAITAQNTRTVAAVEPVSPAMVAAQIDAVFGDLEVRAVKIGMVGGADVITVVADRLAALLADNPVPVVLDPVMVAKSGDALLPDDAVSALREQLIPLATVLTPNLPEAARLLGRPAAATPEEMREQGEALRALGADHVLMKGGHASEDACTDLLVGPQPLVLTAPRQQTPNTHGTGCSLSSAIAAGLAQGMAVPDAVTRAHGWLQGAIAAADELAVGLGHGPVHHFHALWRRT
ncbi:bifunctional hydroxymethylpyrimidine kinase/phosphomethylpyrimidine kinase [Paracoccus sp. PS-1]|uniref:bifunctional hydroxymethylpyrimidine kinase/phosphomethylpyrimidine kinase n=1 Tax=unclassified Paracoccus (in: a-proteobacteria) TaxID=2688777 RepID=UPI00049012EE|nr:MULTISPECIES: bifunctional hydroxymethylpyrimidine kinase/phosphomethylpyrimidine kinase [unclassified Paracoccus (in: a-proteobacteria)]MDQ7261813.1 bifunctional hydroxymethylpyrimidine kinase/phosphomethylpyrimidine kinase [Paracoccus sp. PS1]